jgi:diacylglycerol O-acyltransferase / wax synthase
MTKAPLHCRFGAVAEQRDQRTDRPKGRQANPQTEQRERTLRFEQKMTDAEALMWTVEKDPWLNPSGGVVTILDRPLDADHFRARIMQSVAKIPRLRERVVSPVGRLTNPEWVLDREFDPNWHIRHIGLPSPGTDRQLFDLVALLLADPYDRTRPLWQFVIIDGLSDGRGALFWRFHHSIMDGKGALRLTESYMDASRDLPHVEDVDLAGLLAADGSGGETTEPVPGSHGRTAQVADLLKTPLSLARRISSELMMIGADTSRITDRGAEVAGAANEIRELLATPEPAGSKLWSTRSRHRHVEALTLPLDRTKSAAKALGGSVNDFFVAGAVEGARAYHQARGESPDHFTVTFVVSTRQDAAIGGNSFTPAMVRIPLGDVSVRERIASVGALMGGQRSEISSSGSGLIEQAAALAKMMPTSVLADFGRKQASGVDFATSNMRGARFEVYIAGAKMLRNVTLGPVAGTAFNLTCLSMGSHLDVGMHIDPVAVDDPADLRRCMEQAYDSMFAIAESGAIDAVAVVRAVKPAKEPEAAKAEKSSKAAKDSKQKKSGRKKSEKAKSDRR